MDPNIGETSSASIEATLTVYVNCFKDRFFSKREPMPEFWHEATLDLQGLIWEILILLKWKLKVVPLLIVQLSFLMILHCR